jgi:hypothetical protein
MDLNAIPLAARRECRGIQYACIARTEREQVRRHAASFGVIDAKGREFGHMYTIDREVWVIDADSNLSCQLDDLDATLGETFLVEPQGLRDGATFGALPVASYKRFRTLAEAQAYADKVIASAEKRAIKKASA